MNNPKIEILWSNHYTYILQVNGKPIDFFTNEDPDYKPIDGIRSLANALGLKIEMVKMDEEEYDKLADSEF